MEKTLRDEIAIAAMQGIIIFKKECRGFTDSIAKTAYLMADTMLEARKEIDNA